LPVTQTFKPPLPSELIVEFSIHRGELVRACESALSSHIESLDTDGGATPCQQLLEAFTLVATQKPITNIPEGCATRKEFVGCVWCVRSGCRLPACLGSKRVLTLELVPSSAFRGQRVEIVEYASTSVPIPQLEEMLSHLDDQIAWLVHVRDNVKALLDCQDMYYDYN
jgi:hypothetical protein